MTGEGALTWQDDLAGAGARQHAEVLADAAAIAEAARGRTQLADRLRAGRGVVQVRCLGGVVARGEVGTVAADIIELTDESTSWLLSPDAVTLVTDLPVVLPPHSPVPAPRVPLTWGMALRPWTDAPIALHLRDATVVRGVLRAVGADHLDVRVRAALEHAVPEHAALERPVQESTTAGSGAHVVTVPFSAVAAAHCG